VSAPTRREEPSRSTLRRGGARLTPPIAAPSILSADFSRLADELCIVDPDRDWVHCDVMDNHFVPNLTFGPLLVAAVRKLTTAFVDVHLMIEQPETLIGAFRDAGADQITVHLEAEHRRPLSEVLAMIRELGVRAGLALKPRTSLAQAEEHLAAIDNLLIMTVEPGFGGQEFMSTMLDKVREAVAWRDRHGARWLVEVDGGIAPDTARLARAAGAEVFVAGHAIYRQPDSTRALEALRQAIGS
jgi:ribulose-phosphate 3-epimerase